MVNTLMLNKHKRSASKYAEAVAAGLSGGELTLIERRTEQFREKSKLAQKAYIDHIREHGCDIQKTESPSKKQREKTETTSAHWAL